MKPNHPFFETTILLTTSRNSFNIIRKSSAMMMNSFCSKSFICKRPLSNLSRSTRALLSTTTDIPKTPFYGSPRPQRERTERLPHQKLALAIHHAVTAFSDPTRADAVAALGEITGQVSLERIHRTMMDDPTGRIILEERPVVSKANIPYQKLIKDASEIDEDDDNITFGQAYGRFLQSHGFDPDGRDKVKYIEDETLSYIMLRYRQCHDFWHALTGLPPTVLGELGLKYLELFQTGLPIAALSSTVGSLRLPEKERQVLLEQYLPWAMEHGQNKNSSCALMNVYYEKEFDTPLLELRERLNLEPAPKIKF